MANKRDFKDARSKRIKCPVCQAEYWSHTLKMHITHAANNELVSVAKTQIKLKDAKHHQFKLIHTKTVEMFDFEIDL